ncbi:MULTISPECIES: DNA polymerase III subunit delta' [Paeniglutamicibacter]|uniref:DNA polymerase-3 subunit delta n=1 Tax=Paeniglutamicibacter sulfureus TaxID=43666 RepID=A0ABU2BH33_9MICC|nr:MULTISPECIES: DNA polymerase III subunit delta' [Paeniglutamicibacter]MCV9995937.1 DNA polymerase III subunit delta' [Paeniglutamicibacter sp. ZC-3]MDO2933540.1 DNA polymerase III subunit delta' [Paeniglutamicibacter sulfureus]MDR7357957.1 DNA polymerase-3 subunit delta' [Paeniglutamicibacter sulfureus]
MDVWDDLPGQEKAIAALRRAVAEGNPAHAWLFTGPPGSGRSNAARAFAAALQCQHPDAALRGCGSCKACVTVLAGTHPDVALIATEKVNYQIEDVRTLITKAQDRPSTAPWRVIIVEDADRMTERTTNVLLKSIEEPPPHTVWILCAPSPADVLVTIRSRCRSVSLAVPTRAAVAELLVRRDGLSEEQADFAARVSQSHIGIARRLARDPEARRRRDTTVRLPLRIRTVSDAVMAAAELVELSTAEATASATERAEAEAASLRTALGLEADAPVPPQQRSAFKALEENAKRRARRATHDALDRSLIDMTTFFRDVLLVQLNASTELVNDYLSDPLHAYANASRPETTVAKIDAIAEARARIGANVAPLLAIEAMMVSLRPTK